MMRYIRMTICAIKLTCCKGNDDVVAKFDSEEAGVILGEWHGEST